MINFQKERKTCCKLTLVIKCKFETKREQKFLSLGFFISLTKPSGSPKRRSSSPKRRFSSPRRTSLLLLECSQVRLSIVTFA